MTSSVYDLLLPLDVRLLMEAESIAAGTARVVPRREHVALLLSVITKQDTMLSAYQSTMREVRKDLTAMQEWLK